jgi:tetratricopeptide (TPR) repeat protein
MVGSDLLQNPTPAGLAFEAHLLCEEGDYDLAEKKAREAVALKKDDPDVLEVLASILQIQAARHLSSAGNLKQPKMWFETHFDEYPPAEYIYRRMPSPAELAQAAELEKKAAQLAKFAEECLTKAADGAGPSAQGWYYRATLQRVRGDAKGARESLTKAVALQPDFEQAWFQLAGICTELRDGDAAIAARAKAESLTHTTAQSQLNALWHKIPRGDFKTAREIVAAGVEIDAADPRLPAYLAVIDEAAEKPADALAHYRMAKAISDARLALRGVKFGATEKDRRPISVDEAALPAAIRLRIAAILLDQNKPVEAGVMFAEADVVLQMLAAENLKTSLPDAMLPNPATPAGVVPVADSVATLQIRAAAGALYSQWAAQMKSDAAARLAAQTYRRMFITYIPAGESIESMRAIADLGTAELYLYSKNFPEAAAAMKSTPAVPQEFWQEMRQAEAAIRAGRPR